MAKNINGIVSQMNRINMTVNALKFVSIFSIVIAALVSIGSMVYMSYSISQSKSEIYVLDNGQSFSARAQDVSITREDEVYDHVRTMHEFLFNIAPDKDMIERNLKRALNMGDGSIFDYYNDLQETGFYKRMISTNSFQQIDIQSIEIDMSTYPYNVVVMGHQYINRESNISQYSFVSKCKVADATRNKDNLHGLTIEDFQVIENKLIETRNK